MHMPAVTFRHGGSALWAFAGLAALEASWATWPGGAAKPLRPHIFLLIPSALETGCAQQGLIAVTIWAAQNLVGLTIAGHS